jgi:hypothetical protein
MTPSAENCQFLREVSLILMPVNFPHGRFDSLPELAIVEQ